MRGVLQEKIQTTRVPFITWDNEFKSSDGFDLKRFVEHAKFTLHARHVATRCNSSKPIARVMLITALTIVSRYLVRN